MNSTNILEDCGCFQCPFTWELGELVKQGISDKPDVIKTLNYETVKYEFKTIICYITLCYDLCRNNEVKEAMDAIEKYEKKIMKIFDMQPMSDFQTVLKHVLLSTKLCVMLHYKDYKVENLIQILKEIPSVDITKISDKAAMMGIKATVISLYDKSAEIIITYGREIVKLDPEQPGCHYLLGKTLAESRRYYHPEDAPSDEEIEELEKAIEIYKSSRCHMLLSSSYADSVLWMYKENKYKTPSGIKGQTYHQLAKKCVQILNIGYGIGIEGNEAGPGTLVGFARVFMKLPQPYGNMEMAEKCLMRALELDPNKPSVSHQLGLYYARKENFQDAIRYSKDAAMKGFILGQLDYLRYNMKLDMKFDFLKEIDDNIDRYEGANLAAMLCAKASYFLFIKKDIEEGIRLYVKAIEISGNNYFVKKNKSTTVNINVEEITKLLKEKAPDEFTKYTPLYIQLVNTIIPSKNNQ